MPSVDGPNPVGISCTFSEYSDLETSTVRVRKIDAELILLNELLWRT